ncbi:ATP-binding protein [Streptomyces sp. NPDC051567]|uniref:ATP-binding protein n=1 Tax=Streptomyces sp. NPDC051567 TaxID=3365660 RepID=UPI003798DD9A
MDRTHGRTQGQDTGVPGTGGARQAALTAGAFALTVDPADGTGIEARPSDTGTGTGSGATTAVAGPGAAGADRPDRTARAERPARRAAAARAARDAAARPPVPPGPLPAARLSPEREEERDRLVALLGRGRSVRLTGPAGSGRTTLLDAVADRCAHLAPDGVVRLSGHGHQHPGELLHALHAAVYEAPGERPGRDVLLDRVREIGAVVLLDDLELSGPALDELLRATPECAYLLAATPENRAACDDTHLEEVFLGGLGEEACTEMLETALGRPLTEEEGDWARELRTASGGLPLRFVQAAALLRGRDGLRRTEDDDEEPGVFEGRPREAVEVPLPTPAEAAAPAALLAARAGGSVRAALRIACALGGELPHHAHLPALVGDAHADTAVAELLGSGLVTPVGPRYRLAAGVARQLAEAGYADTAAEEARTAARHYAWWTGHASVTPGRVAAEADAVLAALAGADVVAAVLLARTAAPAFAASLHWEAWERVLRAGAEAARKAGEVAEQAYFHHELGVLALCEGRLDRARAELETSVGLRGALADRRGTETGRRALALVADGETAGAAGATVSPPLRLEPPAAGTAAVPPAAGAVAAAAGPAAPVVVPAVPAAGGAGPVVFAPVIPVPPAAGPVGRPAAAVVPGTTDPVVSGASGERAPAAPVARAAQDARVVPAVSEAVTRVTPVTPVASEAVTTATPVVAATTVTAALPVVQVTTVTPVVRVSPPASEASSAPGTPPVPGAPPFPEVPASRSTPVTVVTPVIRPPGATVALPAMFEDAFPPAPAPELSPVPEPVPGPAPASGRRLVLLAVAGALTLVALGTVVALAMSSPQTAPPPKGPVGSSAPVPALPAVPGTGGHDPVPESASSAPVPSSTSSPSAPSATGAGRSPSTRPEGGPNPASSARTTPPRRPASTSPASRPTRTASPSKTTGEPPSTPPTPGGSASASPTGPAAAAHGSGT